MALLYIMTYDDLCELICWKLLFLILGADSAMGVDKTDRRQIWGRGWREKVKFCDRAGEGKVKQVKQNSGKTQLTLGIKKKISSWKKIAQLSGTRLSGALFALNLPTYFSGFDLWCIIIIFQNHSYWGKAK